MAFLLAGTALKGPQSIQEDNNTQMAVQRTLSGSINRDFFGSNKRIWVLDYKNVNVTAFNVINNIYQTYLSTGTAQTFQVTETNYTVSQTNVFINLQSRGFNVRGSSYISDFQLILTEE